MHCPKLVVTHNDYFGCGRGIEILLLKYLLYCFSFVLQVVFRTSIHPPLMQQAPYTNASPYKEKWHARKPSDRIGNTYSLKCCDISMAEIQKRRIEKVEKRKGITYTCLLS